MNRSGDGERCDLRTVIEQHQSKSNFMEIRRYRKGEEEAIWQIVFWATRVSIARDYHSDLIDRWAPHDRDMGEWSDRLAAQIPFVAIMEGVPVGMAELEDTGFIDYFYVHPEFQGIGVGKALLAAIENEALRMGVRQVDADVSVTAEPFFSAMGFTIAESRLNTILGHPAPNFAMFKPIKGS